MRSWLQTQYPKKRKFNVFCKKQGGGEGPDCTVKKEGKLLIQVEVKGNEKSSNLYDGLGQCMWYLYEEKVKTYLASPYDLSIFKTSIKELKNILDYNDSKIGLLAIRENGSIVTARKAKI